MKLETLSKNLITPSSPTPPHLQNLKISCLDQFPLPFYVATIFYYQATGDRNTRRSEQLKKSLSETLTLFYPLAGRFNKGNLSIDCNDKGVEFVEAHVSGSISQLLEGAEHDTQFLNLLVPLPFQPDNSPLVIVHLNKFDCGGVAIGVGISHTVADAFSIFTFVDSWATTSRIGTEKVHSPSFKLSSLCPPRDMPSFEVPIPGKLEESKILMERFVFNGTKISKLKLAASTNSDGLKLLKHQPTRVEVVVALIWKTLIKVAQARHGHLRPSLLTVSINMRGKTALQIPECSLGNFIATSIARFTPAAESSKVELHDLVGRVHDGITSTIADCAKASSADDLFAIVNNVTNQINETLSNGETDVYFYTSWCRFPIYEADFGFGKPAWASTSDMKIEHIGLLLDTKDGGGIEAWVSLDENKMFLFRQDPDIIEFTSLKAPAYTQPSVDRAQDGC